MNALKILALALVIGGGLGLAYGSFSFTKETHTAEIGGARIHIDVGVELDQRDFEASRLKDRS